jgi:hypothetical protein
MSAYFVDLKGNRSGVVLGQVYNEIPNAYVEFLRGSENQWSQLGMPMISVPADVVGSIRVTGATDKPINVTAFGAGNVVSVQDLAVDEKTASDIRLDQAKCLRIYGKNPLRHLSHYRSMARRAQHTSDKR